MNITKEDRAYLNALAAGPGAEALEYLAKRLFDYYAHEAVYSEGDATKRHQGAATLADWLKKLPKGLRDGDATSSGF